MLGICIISEVIFFFLDLPKLCLFPDLSMFFATVFILWSAYILEFRSDLLMPLTIVEGRRMKEGEKRGEKEGK